MTLNRWGIPGVGYLDRGKNRPKLLYIYQSRYLLMFNSLLDLFSNIRLQFVWNYTVEMLLSAFLQVSPHGELVLPGSSPLDCWHWGCRRIRGEISLPSPFLHPSLPLFLRSVTVRSWPAGPPRTTMASLTSPPSILMDLTCQVKVTVKLASVLLGDDHKVCHWISRFLLNLIQLTNPLEPVLTDAAC